MEGKQTPVQPHIEKLRTKLEHTAMKHGDLLHPEVIRISQELDLHLVRIFREQLHHSKILHAQAANPGIRAGGK
ncbi:Spo0E family sporulation regulatory protein-aspartic acid phosphatase [Effusibacillus consociatus]|uniref:Spo0E family sporulation regulatory protein-aspartic acid phosphatase n=1 Tax=Effusibacillus consociatus TaxID=1117041 RepID=A0ABV9PVT4_9BACL